MSRKKKQKRVSQREWSLYNLQRQQEWFTFFALLPKLVDAVGDGVDLWLGQGRPPLRFKAVLTCFLVWKRFPQMDARTVKGFLDFLKFHRIINVNVPSTRTLLNYQANPRLRYYLHRAIEETARPLVTLERSFATDMTGEKTKTFSPWYCIRTDKQHHRRDHMATHITTGTKSNIVTAIDVRTRRGEDNTILQSHVQRTSHIFTIEEWSGDGAYYCRENCRVVAAIGAKPYFKPRRNASGKSKGCMPFKLMTQEFKEHSEETNQHYHKRSNAESTNESKKQRIGSITRNKNETAKELDIHGQWIAYNLLVLNRAEYEWGIVPKWA